ncbi:MAG TPA: RecQ family ATP-dependent DNA helicase, partial [Planctomycetes bacterium]|nr:RecQ family ATP-dependent DNA helicase [Planctomycetota bacterium]
MGAPATRHARPGPSSMATPTLELDDDTLERELRKHFGHAGFQGRQLEVVRAVLAGRDVLVTMPTGAGKSLLYQFPAILLDGLTVVVSPLIALMKDQVDALRAKGLRASFVNSSISAAERAKRLAQAERGELDLLFVTPERFRSPAFRELAPRLSIARMAVDEAHCISGWGHDFRPDYWRLGEARALLGDPPTIALTATATPQVARDIEEVLHLRDPLVVRTGIERANLFLGAVHVESTEEKIEHLARRVSEIDGAGIVYSALIRDLEHLHDEFRRRGIRTLVYHGKLSPEERRGMQERFLASERDVVLATNAFGMGIDKADIRFVLHAQIPRTLEAWTQEVGRAGRDGERSFCELCYFEEDLAVQQNFISWANPSREYLIGVYETLRGWGERLAVKDLDDLRDELLVKQRADNRVSIALKWLEVLGVTRGSFETHDLALVREFDPAELPDFVGTEEKKRANLEALLTMLRFARGEGVCRRVALERHFGLPESGGDCGACDVCATSEGWLESMPSRPVAATTEEGR